MNEKWEMEFTGERMINHPNSLLYEISLERYKFAQEFVRNKIVLDIACGSGYGANHLAKEAKSVLGVDVDSEVIEYCRQKYSQNNLSFQQIAKNAKEADFLGKFEAIVSFETLEHTAEPDLFLQNLKEYLTKDGLLILSTPNNFQKISPPENKYHTYEFDILELYEKIKNIFKEYDVSIFGQCKTDFKRVDDSTKQPLRRVIFAKLAKIIYSADQKYFRVLQRIEHFKIYKFFSRLQRDANFSSNIYPIDPKENFFNPEITLLVIKK